MVWRVAIAFASISVVTIGDVFLGGSGCRRVGMVATGRRSIPVGRSLER